MSGQHANDLISPRLSFAFHIQLGLNDTKDRGDNDGDVGNLLPFVSIGTGVQAVEVTAGLRHTAAILDDGTIRGWGYNAKGQLGVGTTLNVGDGPGEMGDNMVVTDIGTVTPATIAAGGWHTCAVTDDKQLKCWGKSTQGCNDCSCLGRTSTAFRLQSDGCPVDCWVVHLTHTMHSE